MGRLERAGTPLRCCPWCGYDLPDVRHRTKSREANEADRPVGTSPAAWVPEAWLVWECWVDGVLVETA